MILTLIMLAIYFSLRATTLNLGGSDATPMNDEPEGGTHI